LTEARLTVLMPVRAYHPPFLERAIGSLRAQTSPEWRLMIIDDGATWNDVLESACADSRVDLVKNEGRRLAGALNTGMRMATTEFVAELFADDMWSKDAARILTANIENHPEVDFFHSGRVFIDEHDRQISSVYPGRESFRLEDFEEGSPVRHLLCWRREQGLAAGGIDESINSVGPDDYDFPWCMAERGAVFRAIPEPLYLYRDHRECERLTTHLPLSVHKRELRRIMQKHNIPPERIERRIADAQRVYLGQCLYRSRLDRWLKVARGHDPRKGWREPYRAT
jgi:glycosyltransferase involved in cell wall biosynthesis